MQYHTHSDTKVNAVNNMIDTLKYSEEFKKAGFDDKQSKALAHTIANTIKQISPNSDEIATKLDIKKLELKIEQTKSKLLQWIIGIFSGQTAILITAFYTITKP